MRIQFGRNIAAVTVTCAAFLASALLLVAEVDDHFSNWSAPVNLGPPANTSNAELNGSLSKDGLSLYFACFNCPGGFGGNDIWVTQRASVDAPWGPPQNLGPNINTAFNEADPTLSFDGHRLYFQSTRPGGFGGTDIYVSRRHNNRDDFAWQPPENLGSGVNTFANEGNPTAPFEDEKTGAITLYFTSDRPGGMGGDDIYASMLQPDETFGPAVLVEELSTPFQDRQPAIRRDGLEMFLASNRPGTFGALDLWVSTRASTSEPWSTPVNLGPVVNSVFIDANPWLSFRGTELYFQSSRPGGFGDLDLWRSTRTKLPEPDEDNH